MPVSPCTRIVAVLACLGCIAPIAAAERVTFARHLALSPDGATLAFTWAGDIWSVPISGGMATRLTVHPARDDSPVWSHDGKHIAFASDRHGAADVFRMTADGADVRRLTFADRSETPSAWSNDDQSIYFSSRKTGEVMWEERLYLVPAAGGQSVRVMEAMGHEASPGPDGRWLAFARGASRWWRTGYRGSANWDIWLRDLESGAFRQLTDFDGTDMNPTWAPDARGVYFLSDRRDTHNVWFHPLAGGQPRQITRQSGDRVRDYSVSGNGKRLAYTVWDKVFVADLPDASLREISILAGADAAENDIELETFTRDADEAAVSPDGEEIAIVVRGEVYVIKTADDKPTRRVTENPARDWRVTWSPDGKALFFVSDRSGQEDIYRATSAEDPPKPLSDSLRFKIERVTDNPETEQSPQISSDGKQMSFLRGRGEWIVRDLATGAEHVLVPNWNQVDAAWSPDSKWIAYAVEDEEYNSDVWIVPADASAPAVNISQHPDSDGNPKWSADGQVLAFASAREGFDSDLYMVFLSSKLDESSSVVIDEYFKTADEAVKKRKPIKDAVASGMIALGTPSSAESQPATAPTSEPSEKEDESAAGIEDRLRALLKEFLEGSKKDDANDKEKDKAAQEYEYDLATAYQRIRRVTSIPGDQTSFALAPAGDMLVFGSNHEGDGAIYSIKWNGRDQKKILSFGAGGLHWTLDGKRLVYLRSGTPGSCSSSGGDTKSHAFRAKMAIDHRAEARQKFSDAGRRLGLWFYHPTMKGLDWPALTQRYSELALTTRTGEEFNEIFNLLQGELNGSHLGIYPPGGGGGDRVGYLGCEIDAKHAGPGLRILAVTPRGPADRAESKLNPGDILLEVNGLPVGANAALDAALIDTVGDETIIKYIPAATDTPASNKAGDDQKSDAVATTSEPSPKELVIRPISYAAWSNLQYDAWVDANRKYVEGHSDGRVGYAHIRGMGEPQFYTFERDLYAAAYGKDGLIVDVRNNGGGWTADWVMAVLNVRRHAYTVGRGGRPGYPQSRLVFYSWVKPATMMCNQFSYSNAEIVSHAFKNLHRGPLVGTTTFGAVISTGAYGLIDGGRIRQPFRGWYTLPGELDMELHGAEPDVKVDLTPADEESGAHPQLDAAIRATLEQCEREKQGGSAP